MQVKYIDATLFLLQGRDILMLALLAEKAFILRELDGARNTLQTLDTKRSGIFVKEESFSVLKLAKLLQDIARAKLAELRLSSFMLLIEEKLRAVLHREPAHVVQIGSAPESMPRYARPRMAAAFFLLMQAQPQR